MWLFDDSKGVNIRTVISMLLDAGTTHQHDALLPCYLIPNVQNTAVIAMMTVHGDTGSRLICAEMACVHRRAARWQFRVGEVGASSGRNERARASYVGKLKTEQRGPDFATQASASAHKPHLGAELLQISA
jgi:hypothetical protein